MMSGMLGELRYSWRSLMRSKGFTFMAVLLLGLGMGASTAIFSLVNSVLFKSLAAKNPERLVLLTDPASSGISIGSDAGERTMLTYTEFTDLRKRMTAFSDMFAVDSQWRALNAIIDRGVPEEVRLRLVSGSYFATLGVAPMVGRTFTAGDENGPNSAPLAVISYPFWRDRFHLASDVLGKVLRIQGASFHVIGVMPPNFLGENIGGGVDLWIPIVMQPQLRRGQSWLEDDPGRVERTMWLQVFGRLRDGLTLEHAQSEASVVFHQMMAASFSRFASSQPELLKEKIKLRPGNLGVSTLRSTFGEPLQILLGMVGVLLLIACANVAGLMLARATSRRKEVAMRFALGATRLRLVRQFLAEALIVALAALAAGAAIAAFTTQALIQFATGPGDHITLDLQPDLRVFAFLAVIACVATFISGLAPAFLSSRANLNDILKGTSGGVKGGSGRLRMGKMVVASQVTLSTLLLMAAGWFVFSLRNLATMDLGYPREDLLQVRVDPVSAGYKLSQLGELYPELQKRLAAAPGVRAVAYSDNGLFAGRESADEITIEGYTPRSGKQPSSRWDAVGPGYFTIVGIPLLRGREIGSKDVPGAPRVCVINRAFADEFFPNTDPIGKHITNEWIDSKVTYEIVGVAGNAFDHDLRGKVPSRFYTSALQPMGPGVYTDEMNYQMRTYANPSSLVETARRQIASVNPDLRIAFARPLEVTISGKTLAERLMSGLALGAGILALLITCFGLYAVLSYAVALRSAEIGVRIALGARPERITAGIIGESVVLAGVGLGVGLPGALALSVLVRSRLFGLTAADPATLGLVAGIMLLTAAASALLPAWRASRLDPIRALRTE
jgi:predicted permease